MPDIKLSDGKKIPFSKTIDGFEIANKIKIHSPSALAKTKKAIWQSQETGLHDALQNAWNLISEQQIHPDFEEGTKAFVEKRSPKWKPYNSNE